MQKVPFVPCGIEWVCVSLSFQVSDISILNSLCICDGCRRPCARNSESETFSVALCRMTVCDVQPQKSTLLWSLNNIMSLAAYIYSSCDCPGLRAWIIQNFFYYWHFFWGMVWNGHFCELFLLSSHSSKNVPGGCIVTVFELALTEVARHGVNILVQLSRIPAWLKTAATVCSSNSVCSRNRSLYICPLCTLTQLN